MGTYSVGPPEDTTTVPGGLKTHNTLSVNQRNESTVPPPDPSFKNLHEALRATTESTGFFSGQVGASNAHSDLRDDSKVPVYNEYSHYLRQMKLRKVGGPELQRYSYDESIQK